MDEEQIFSSNSCTSMDGDREDRKTDFYLMDSRDLTSLYIDYDDDD